MEGALECAQRLELKEWQPGLSVRASVVTTRQRPFALAVLARRFWRCLGREPA